jgi:excisionase family DNA binding protein
MNLIDELEKRPGPLKVGELAVLLRVTDKHIYKMVARGQLPSFRLGAAIRIDPRAVAESLRRKFPQAWSLERKSKVA